jgi:hypothetical protein
VNRVSLRIEDIKTDGGTQPRAVLDFNAVHDYTDAMEDGAKFPPVTVFYDGQSYWLADGFHRVRAAYAANFDSIDCDVRQGTIEDAQWFSFSSNRTNGLRRTNDDKQRAVKASLAHPRAASLSDTEIARHCGVSIPTVSAWREKLGLSPKTLGMDTRTVTRNGKTYQQKVENTAARRPRKKRQPEAVAPAAGPGLDTTAAPGDPGEAPSASNRATRSQRIDHLARLTLTFIESSKHFAHLVGWLGETAGEFEEAEGLLSNIIGAIATTSAEIERKALAADPLNASRLEIQEERS